MKNSKRQRAKQLHQTQPKPAAARKAPRKRQVAPPAPSPPIAKVPHGAVSLREFRKDDGDEPVFFGDESPDALPDLAAVEELRPTLADVKRFVVKKKPPAERDEDRISPSVPLLVHKAIDMLATRARVDSNTAALFVFDRGLHRVKHGLPGVSEILSMRKEMALRASGDGHYTWTYSISLGSKERLDMRHIGDQRKADYMSLRRGLHLTATATATIVLIAGLVDMPIAADLCRTMLIQLQDFQDQLRQQVKIVEGIYRDVMDRRPSENQITWSQVLVK